MGRKEGVIETYLKEQVAAAGGVTRKVVYQGRKGSFDRWCFLPGGRLRIVECKAPGESATREQQQELKAMQHLGFEMYIVDSKEAIDAVLAED